MDILTGTHEIQVATVALTGRLDALEARGLRDLLDSHLASGHSRIVVDLRALEFVDSAGLAALVKGMKDCRTAGGDLRLVAPTERDAMRVFELTRFDRVFTMNAELEDALSGW